MPGVALSSSSPNTIWYQRMNRNVDTWRCTALREVLARCEMQRMGRKEAREREGIKILLTGQASSFSTYKCIPTLQLQSGQDKIP